MTEEFNIQGKQTSFYKYCPVTFGYTLVYSRLLFAVIRTDLLEVGCGYMDWIGLAQDRDRWRTLVSAVMNLQVP